MKKITLLLFVALTGMLNVANAQDITVFNFDGTTPTSTGTSTFVSVANPLSDVVNPSTNVGKFTHVGTTSDITIDLTATPIDPKLYTTFKFKLYLATINPASTYGEQFQIFCKNAAGTTLATSSNQVNVKTPTPGWVDFTQNIYATQPITKIVIAFKNGTAAAAYDDIYLDDLIFIKNTGATFLYGENFDSNVALAYDSYVETFAPLTKAGTWSGGVDLETASNANMNLRQGWGTQYNLKIGATNAAVTIPNINVAGYTNLNLSYDFIVDGGGAAEVPNIETSVDGGANWVTLSTVASGGGWYKETKSIALPAGNYNAISLRINPNAVNAVVFDNFKITGTAVASGINQLSDNSIQVYPNPTTNYILTPNAQKVSIVDLNGRIINEAFNTEKVDVSSLANGAYIVKVKTNGITKIGKLIKE